MGAWLTLLCTLACIVTLSGCGKSPAVPAIVATLRSGSISTQEFQRYVGYSEHYYAGLGEVAGGSAALRCGVGSETVPCRRVQRQVLGRLIEEHAIVAYAHRHHISLSPADQARAGAETTSLLAATGGASWPFRSRAENRAFLADVVRRELLVRTVEEHVVPSRLVTGPMLHIRKYLLASPGVTRQALYRQAVDLATDGKPVPAGTDIRTEWITPRRLDPASRQALTDASPGQFVGPFGHAGTYQVIKLLGAGVRRYGKPARDAIELTYFHTWLHAIVQSSHPQCFTSRGKKMACPVQ